MKNRFLPSLSLALVISASLALGADLPWEKRPPFKEAIIHYQLTGSEQGSETLYVRDYGRVRAKHRQASATIMGMTNKTATLELTDPDWVTTYNLIEKTGEKMTNPQKIYQKEYSKFNAEERKNFEKNAKELGSSVMGNFGAAVKQSSAKLLGFDCDVTSVGGMSTVYLLHGTDIPLKSEVSVMGMASTNLATKVDTSASIPDTAFQPPAAISAQTNAEAENMLTGTIEQVMETLKRPDGAKAMQQFGQPMSPAGAMPQAMEGGGGQAEQQQLLREMEAAMKKFNQQKP